MGFHARNRFRINPRHRMSHGNDLGLSFDTGRPKADSLRSIVVECGALDDGVDAIPVLGSILHALKDHHGDTITERGPG